MPFRAIAAAFILLAVSACAERPEQSPGGHMAPGQPVRIAPDLALVMPSPGALGRRLEVSQLVSARYGDQNFVFEGHVSASPERFLLVGLDSMGRRALSVTWTDAGVTAEKAPWLPAGLPVDNMLADMVVLYWPEGVVRQALASSSASLVATPRGRTVLAGGKEVIHADYLPARNDDPWTGRLSYHNLAWGYQLDVQSVETLR